MFAFARIPSRGCRQRWCQRCCGIYWHQMCWCWCIRLLFAGLWCFVQGICLEMLKPWDFLSLSEQLVQRIQLCVLGRICWVIGFNGELVEWGWGEKRKQECFSDLATAAEAALLILWLITIFEIPSSLCDWEKELIAMTVYSVLATESGAQKPCQVSDLCPASQMDRCWTLMRQQLSKTKIICNS